MSEPDWSAALADPEVIRSVLGSPPPPLTDHRLESLLVDERGSSVTPRLSAFAVAAGAAELWRERGHNAYEFVLVCGGVSDFVVDAWSGWPLTEAVLEAGAVTLTGRDRRVSFRAEAIRAEPPVGRLWGRTP
ncbi:hypothetical protein ACWCYY_12260 [Kitasatospora sp. NPDC001664]